jgi:hypothetical protein
MSVFSQAQNILEHKVNDLLSRGPAAAGMAEVASLNVTAVMTGLCSLKLFMLQSFSISSCTTFGNQTSFA